MRVEYVNSLIELVGNTPLLRLSRATDGAKPLVLLHARGDEQVPADFSEELYQRARDPRKLVIVPGGHHRSVQHDAELQSVALRWLARSLAN